MQTIIQIMILFILLFLTVFTAASEIAIIAVNRIKIRKLASGGSKSAATIQKILENPEKLFGTILVINDIVTTLVASIMTIMIVAAIAAGKGVVVAAIAASFIIIVCEVVAKTVAAAYSEKVSLRIARPVSYMIIMFSPVVKMFVKMAKFAVKLVGGKPVAKDTLVTEEEIKAFIRMGEEDGVIQKEKSKMLAKVFDFSNTIVKDVMTPKKDMVAIDINSNFDDIVEKVLESGYSRLPVYRDNPDNIIGIINMKDLLNLSVNRNLVVLQDIIYLAVIFPETKKVSELLKEFQKGHTHLGIVTNQKGKLVGIVTLEDLLEEIVGEIEDEYDVRANYFKNPQ